MSIRTSRKAGPDTRAVATLAGVLLVAIAVLLAVGVATAAFDEPTEPAPTAVISLSAEGDRLVLLHEGGEPIDVQELTVRVWVNGDSLARQPSVPFFSAAGFRPGPTGPFNAASGDEWIVGDEASVRIAGTNDPTPRPGDRVEVRLSVRGQPIASMATTVEPG
ncbi:type IV pilin N-terminal domain-containing protein [Halorubrum tibetense]|uniref:Type IV pilin N-terminal domain-containing protein n=1 Tax=Halorubrum tibetense TaxID=175631 RepID=A0ABD5S7K1_9EURY